MSASEGRRTRAVANLSHRSPRRHVEPNRPSFTDAADRARRATVRALLLHARAAEPRCRARSLRREDGGSARQRRAGHDRARLVETGARCSRAGPRRGGPARGLERSPCAFPRRSRRDRGRPRRRRRFVRAVRRDRLAGRGGSDSLDRGLGSLGARLLPPPHRRLQPLRPQSRLPDRPWQWHRFSCCSAERLSESRSAPGKRSESCSSVAACSSFAGWPGPSTGRESCSRS